MPQLEISTFPSQIFWLVLSFVILYIVLSRIVVPRISSTIKQRENEIKNNLHLSEQLFKDTEIINEEIEKVKNDTNKEAQEIINNLKNTTNKKINENSELLKKRLNQKLEKINFHPLVNNYTLSLEPKNFINFLEKIKVKLHLINLKVYKIINNE